MSVFNGSVQNTEYPFSFEISDLQSPKTFFARDDR